MVGDSLTRRALTIAGCALAMVLMGVGAAPAAAGPDWQHALQVIANAHADPPSTPAIYLFGDSAARECVRSDDSWAAAVSRKLGGARVSTFDLGSCNQTFAQDAQLIPHIPRGSIVLIGLAAANFTTGPYTARDVLPQPAPIPSDYDPHRYSRRHVLSRSQMRALVRAWVATRYPVFKANLARNARDLETLVKACRRQGLHPVIIEMPRNMRVIGHALDQAIMAYQGAARRIARANGLPPVVDFVARAHFKRTDLHDLWHCVEPGRRRWQPWLARETARLVRRYKLHAAARPAVIASNGGLLDIGATAPGLVSPA